MFSGFFVILPFITIVLFFILGACLGSFYNVLIFRLPRNLPFIFARSFCPNCSVILRPRDLIPLLSYLFYQGRCQYCNAKISIRYFIVEFLSGIFTAILALKYLLINFQFIDFFIYLFFYGIFIISSFIDLEYGIIPNKLTYPGIIIAILLSFVSHDPIYENTISSAFLGGILGGGLYFFLVIISPIFYGQQAMGMGDVKFATMAGFLLGIKYTILFIFISSLLGSIVGLILIGLKLKNSKDSIPYGPFLALGVIISHLAGNYIIHKYFEISFQILK